MPDALAAVMPYLGIMAAASLEGEVAYGLAATLVGRGYLNPIGVIVAGTIGASAGDQIYFYLLRGGLIRLFGAAQALEMPRGAECRENPVTRPCHDVAGHTGGVEDLSAEAQKRQKMIFVRKCS